LNTRHLAGHEHGLDISSAQWLVISQSTLATLLQRRTWFLIALILFLVGGFLYGLSFAFDEIFGRDSRWVRLTSEAGLGLMIAMVLAVTLDRLIHESLLRSVDAIVQRLSTEFLQSRDDLKEAFDKTAVTLRQEFAVLDGALHLKVDDLLARRDPAHRERFERKAAEALQSHKVGTIRILCVAGPDIFPRNTLVGEILYKAISGKSDDWRLEVLIACPESSWAEVRDKLERGHLTLSQMRNSKEILEDYQRRFPDRIQFKMYDCQPTDFLIMTDELVFHECYPLADVDGPIGGFTPLIIAKRDSQLYVRWENHFQRMWNNLSHGITEQCIPASDLAQRVLENYH